MAHRDTGIQGARLVGDDEVIRVGALEIRALHTPGHTSGDVCYLLDDRVFTGDTLLIGGCGRTDFQQGDPGRLYDSIHARLFTLPEATLVFPAHDYKGRTHTTIGAEKRDNPRLAGTTRGQFVEIMENLGLPYPKQIDRAVPANLAGGTGVEPFGHPVRVGAQQFFTIPEMVLVRCTADESDPGALPRPADRRCGPRDAAACMSRLPRSRTIGLVGDTGEDCLELEGALSRAGYDVVILDGGRQGLQDAGPTPERRNPAPQASTNQRMTP